MLVSAPPPPRSPLVGWGTCLALGLTAAAWLALAWRAPGGGTPLVWVLATLAVAWGALGWLLWRAPPLSAPVVVVCAVGFRLAALFAPPMLEDDHYRFLWDGYRFAATGDPYAEAPQARFADETIPPAFREVLDQVNYPDVPTVYGPVLEWSFRLAYVIAPAALWPWKLGLLASELAILAMLWPELGRRGRLLLAWCPLAVFETGFNAHPDALAVALVVAGWWCGRKGWALAAGVAVGLAVAAKVFALLAAPFVLWRLGWRSAAMAFGAVLLCYGPFWLGGSNAGLIGLRAMATEWEFNASVYAVATALVSPGAARVLCALAFGALWLFLLARWARAPGPAGALPPGVGIYGGFLLLSATVNPWYALWLWPFVAARPSVAGVTALAAVSLSYVTGLNLGEPALDSFAHPDWVRPVEYGLIGLAAWRDWRQRGD